MKRLHVRYSGRVQGVGFRATVARLAKEFAVTGQVCNLTDGRVDLVAEGELAELEKFRARIAEELRRNIADEQLSYAAPQGGWQQFTVAPDQQP
jgi:acylphosphatase